jgi:xanthine dehydrogenase accessory factor
VATKGSAPREAGARIVLTENGFTGTIGGGTLEWRALSQAQADLAAGRRAAREIDVSLGPDMGQCCGGRVRLGIEIFAPEDAAEVAFLAAAEATGAFATTARLEAGRWRRAIVSHPPVAAGTVLEPDGTLRETFGETPRALFLFGAGHVGRALVLALAPLPFRVTWVDERPDAFPAAVPANARLVATPDPLAVLDTAVAGDFVLVMTHAHQLDLALIDRALRVPGLAYVGVIGSKTKRARFRARLAEAGIAAADIDRMICPIGAVGPASHVPAVIAAATAVELIVTDEAARLAGDAGSEPRTIPPLPSRKATR